MELLYFVKEYSSQCIFSFIMPLREYVTFVWLFYTIGNKGDKGKGKGKTPEELEETREDLCGTGYIQVIFTRARFLR